MEDSFQTAHQSAHLAPQAFRKKNQAEEAGWTNMVKTTMEDSHRKTQLLFPIFPPADHASSVKLPGWNDKSLKTVEDWSERNFAGVKRGTQQALYRP